MHGFGDEYGCDHGGSHPFGAQALAELEHGVKVALAWVWKHQYMLTLTHFALSLFHLSLFTQIRVDTSYTKGTDG